MPMLIDDALISRLEKLSRLQLNSDEREQIKRDLNNILNMIDKLNELDLEQVQPLTHINDQKPYAREDVVEEMLDKEEAIKRAPKSSDGYFVVPKVLKVDGKPDQKKRDDHHHPKY